MKPEYLFGENAHEDIDAVMRRTIRNQEKILNKVGDIEKCALEVHAKIGVLHGTIDRIVGILHGNGAKGVVERMGIIETQLFGMQRQDRTEEERAHEFKLMKFRILLGISIGAVGFGLGVAIKYLTGIFL